MSKKRHVVSNEVAEAFKYYIDKLSIRPENYYIELIKFDKLHELNGHMSNVLFKFYIEQPIKYIAALIDGYQIETPIPQQEGLENFLKGEELVIIHKKTGKRHKVNIKTTLPNNFDLVHLNEWNWYINKDQKN